MERNYIKTFESFVNEEDNNTLKARILDFVEDKGGEATWKEIHDFIMKEKGLPIDRSTRGQFASYFSGHSSYLASYDKQGEKSSYSHGLLMRPTKKDPRYLEKIKRGKYKLRQD